MRANRVMKFSVRALRSLAASTISIMRETVESAYAFVVFMRKTPVRFVLPLKTSLFSCTLTGALSPVRADVSTSLAPLITSPSIGTRSPGFTTITLPTRTLAGSIWVSLESTSTVQTSGTMSSISVMLLRLLPTAKSSNSSPIW